MCLLNYKLLTWFEIILFFVAGGRLRRVTKIFCTTKQSGMGVFHSRLGCLPLSAAAAAAAAAADS